MILIRQSDGKPNPDPPPVGEAYWAWLGTLPRDHPREARGMVRRTPKIPRQKRTQK